jgi:hypothetical protein
LHTKNHRLSRSDEPFRNTTGSANLEPKKIRFGARLWPFWAKKKLEFGGQIWVPKWDRFLAPKIGIVAPPIKILIWGSYVGQKGASFGDQNRVHFWPHFWLKKQFFGQKTCQFRAIISGPNFCPPQDFWPYYVATFVSLELGPFCAVNRVLTIQTTLDSRVLVLSQQCPRWQATYNGQNVAEATLVERGLCSSTWTRPPSPSTMVSRKAWSYSLSLRRQELSQ